MSESHPPEPPTQSKRLSLDERIALLIAFLGFGTIGIWAVMSQGQSSSWLQAAPGQPHQMSPASPSASPTPPASHAKFSPAASEHPAIVPQGLQTDKPPAAIPTPPTPPSPTPIGATPEQPAQTPPSASTASVAPVAPSPSPSQASHPPAAALPPSPIAFQDVPANFWASRYINKLSRRGLLTGFPDGRFQPNQPITRAEFARLVVQALNPQPSPATPKSKVAFKDLKANHWATSAIEQVTQAGFMAGYPGQIFRPDQPIPRVQLWVAIATGLKLPPNPQAAQALAIYRDTPDIPKWAIPQMGAAAKAGLVVTPAPNQLSPNQPATRADAAAYLYQALVKANKIKP